MNRADLRNDIRSLSRLWPNTDALAAAVTTTTQATWTLGSTTYVTPGSLLQADNEIVLVVSVASPVATVIRAQRGTVAATHLNAAPVNIYAPSDITDPELNSLIRDGVNWLYPVATKEVNDDSLTTLVGTKRYTIPAAVLEVDELYLKSADGTTWEGPLRNWSKIGTEIQILLELPAGRLLRIRGDGRYAAPVNDTDDLTSTTPPGLGITEHLVSAIKYFCLAQLAKGQELLRSRFTQQSALIESRSGNLPELLGSSRELMRIATDFRSQAARIKPFRLRAMQRWS